MKASVIAVTTIAVLVLTGCGSGSSESTDSGPLEGREVGRASQLEGTWLGASEGDFVGFEFMEDGKVLATPFTAALTGYGGGVMYSYSILEGGRLSLMTPNGQTQVYGVKIAGDQMELSGAMMLSQTNSQRFRRLPRGQTIEQGMEEQARLDAEDYERRYKALIKYLDRDDLVMVPSTPAPNAPAAIALDLVPSGTGRGWYDDKPPHLDAISTAIEPTERDGSVPAVRIRFGEQLDPPPSQARGGGQITFDSSGDVDAPRLVANVNYGGQSFELEIRRDAGLHRDIVGRFDAEKARIEALRAPLLAALKDYVVIEGRSGAQMPTQATEDHFVLVRDAATGAFAGQGMLRYENRAPQEEQITAEVVVFGEVATLVIKGFYRQYQLTLANATSGEFAGAWFPSGQQNGWQTSLSITEAIDSAERERRAEAQRAALRAIPPGAQYIGRASILNESWGVPQPFVVLTVTPSGDTFNVAARYPSIDLSVAMTGLIAEAPTGPALQLSNGRMEIGSQISGILALNHVERQLQGQAWSLRVAEPGNAESHLVGSGTRMGTIDLEPMTDAWKRRQAETIRNALTTGAKFHAWVTTMRHEQASVFEFKLDAASGQLTGANPEMSRTFSLRPGTNFIGSLSEDLGSFHGTFKMAQANLADRSMDWWAFVEPDNNILLIGSFGQISTNRRMKPSFEMTLVR